MNTNSLIDMPAREYHARPELNFSRLKFMEVPAQFAWHFRQGYPVEQTADMKFGTLVHTLVLEPDLFATQYVCSQKFDCRYKAQKEAKEIFEAENAGKIIVEEEDYAKATAMAMAVRAHPYASLILDNASTEKAIFWQDLETDVKMRCRPDVLRADLRLKADIKTINKVPTFEEARREIANRDYHAQSAMYADGCALGADLQIEHDVLIFVGKTAPYIVACYELSLEALATGRNRYRAWLHKYMECQRKDQWPGLDGIETIDLPAWAK